MIKRIKMDFKNQTLKGFIGVKGIFRYSSAQHHSGNGPLNIFTLFYNGSICMLHWYISEPYRPITAFTVTFDG